MGVFPACYGSKSTVHEYFQRWNKAGVMAEIFRILLAEYREKSVWTSNGRLGTAPCYKPDALSKNQRLRARAQPDGQGPKRRQETSPYDGQGFSLRIAVTGANVHDSRLIGAPLKNSQEMGG